MAATKPTREDATSVAALLPLSPSLLEESVELPPSDLESESPPSFESSPLPLPLPPDPEPEPEEESLEPPKPWLGVPTPLAKSGSNRLATK